MNEYFQLFVLFNKKIRIKLNYLVLYDKQAITVCPGPIVVFLILNLFYISATTLRQILTLVPS